MQLACFVCVCFEVFVNVCVCKRLNSYITFTAHFFDISYQRTARIFFIFRMLADVSHLKM